MGCIIPAIGNWFHYGSVGIFGISGYQRGRACRCGVHGCGIYLGYKFFGVPAGHFIVLGTAVAGIFLTWYSLRARTWKRLSLDTRIDSKVEGVDPAVKAGDAGVTVGRLAPMGKVKVGDSVVEALSESGYVDTNREVEIVKVYADKIIVKLKTEEHG